MRKKILLCTPIYPPEIGGPATYTKELVEKLHDKYDLTVLTYGDAERSPALDGAKLILIKKDASIVVRTFLFTLKLLQISKKYDLIYVQNAVAAGLPVYINKKINKTPYILKFVGDESWERASQRKETSHFLEDYLDNYDNEKLSKWVRTLHTIQGVVLRAADIVTTPSQYLGLALVKHYKVEEGKMKTNYNASDIEERELDFPVVKKQYQICATARLTKWKGIDGIIHASKILKEKFPDFTCVIAGDGPELESLQNLSRELGTESYVKFLGRVSREETYKLRKESSVYVLNSTYEGLPHTALTSFQAQIPIVATDTPGTNEAVYDGVSGLLVPVNNSEKLAEAIAKLLSDEVLQKKLVDGGTKILNEKFSWESHLNNLEIFFDSIAINKN